VDSLINSIIFPNFDAEEEIKIEFQLVYNGHPNQWPYCRAFDHIKTPS
jgi:hypothetical protein